MKPETRIPVQGDGPVNLHPAHRARVDWTKLHGGRKPIPSGTIMWWEHVKAWEEYARRGHGDQSALRIVQRHGFSFLELVDLLGHDPETWEARGATGWKP